MDPAGSPEHVVEYMKKSVIGELKEIYPDLLDDTVISLADAMSRIHAASGKKFIVIIDEWDVLIRDQAANSQGIMPKIPQRLCVCENLV